MSRLLPSGLAMENWQGEEDPCIELRVAVPPDLLAGSGGSYEVAAILKLQPGGGGIPPFSGMEALGPYYLLPAVPGPGQQDETRRRQPDASAGRRVFVSYSRKDELYRQRLVISLTQLKRNKLIAIWHDLKILPGQEWDREIGKNLNSADIVLLLVSPDFLASDYAYSNEMSRALDRHRAGTAMVVPIIVRPSDWKNSPLGSLQALPSKGHPVSSWSNRDAAWLDVVQGLRRLIADQG